MLSRIRSLAQGLFGRRRFEDDMSDEIAFHIESYVEDLVRRGVSREEATRRARLEFGGRETIKEECREAKRFNVLDKVTRDLRYACRSFVGNPGFSFVVLLTLALGIGSTIAIFSVVYGVLLKPLPFSEPERLMQVFGAMPARNLRALPFTEANFWDMRDLNQSFEEFGTYSGASFTLTGFEMPERVSGARVSAGFFRALGARPVLGRIFNPGEDDPGAAGDVALLSHSFWTRRFGGDAGVVGRRIALGGSSFEVVGVLPRGTPWLDRANVFVPFIRQSNADRTSWEFTVIGRLKRGITPEAAQTDLTRVARDLEDRFPENKDLGVMMLPSETWIANDQLRRTLWILLGSVGLLLTIACVNVTNLLLARASSRIRDGAMRVALGAARRDLIRERLTEALALSSAGAALGCGVALALLRVFRSMDGIGIPRLAEAEINGWVVAFTLCAALLVGVVTGIAPALQAPMSGIVAAIQNGRGSVGNRGQQRLRGILVGVEVALSVVLLVGAGLLVRSLMSVLSVDRGFQTEGRLLATVSLPGAYPEERRAQIAADLLSRIDSRPEVLAVSSVSGQPLAGGSTGMGIAAADIALPDDQVPWASWRLVTTDYFDTMGLKLIEGRGFTEQDIVGKPWRVIVSKRLATLLWKGESPIGRTATLWRGQNQREGEVIGVVSDMRERGLESGPTLATYFPAYGGLGGTTLRLVMHVQGAPEQFGPALRSVVGSVDPSLPVSDIRTMEETVNSSVATRRFTLILLATFAALALLLALAGVYGIVEYSLARRTSEIGLRLAVGAPPSSVLSLVMRQGLRPVAIGMVIGLGSMYWLAQLMRNLLFGVEVTDWMTYATVVALLAVVSLVSCYLPARRALRIDPAIALRAE